MAINSCKKGAAGERAFCSFLKQFGLDAERTAQHCGKNTGVADIKCEALSDFHFEVKVSGVCDVYGYLEQAERDSGSDKFAVVVYKRQSKTHRGNPWVAMMDARDFIILAQKARDFDNLNSDQRETVNIGACSVSERLDDEMSERMPEEDLQSLYNDNLEPTNLCWGVKHLLGQPLTGGTCQEEFSADIERFVRQNHGR